MMLPSCVPASSLGTSGANLSVDDLLPLLEEKWVLGLGEMMNFPGVLNQIPEVLDKILVFSKNVSMDMLPIYLARIFVPMFLLK